MRIVWWWLAAVFSAQAGLVQGVVLEHVSGRPLARTMVQLQPVAKAGSVPQALSLRCQNGGQFTFEHVPNGLYLIVATRNNYFPAAYGQRRPSGQGTPVEVTEDSTIFAELHMRHKGAVTGRVLDENGVGMTDAPVLAYRARLPVRLAGSAISDDRGVYRIHGLEPGKYWIRSGAFVLEDGTGLLPTFGPESLESREARIHVVTLDADTPDADVRPEQGRLFRVTGVLQCASTEPITVTISSETMRRSVQTGCSFGYSFEGLAPGQYEIFAQGGAAAGFIELSVFRDHEGANMNLSQPARVSLEVVRPGSYTPSDIRVTVTARRKDLYAADKERALQVSDSTLTLAPGHWEMNATAGPGQYVESIGNEYGVFRASRTEQPSDWFDVYIDAGRQARIRITVSDKAAQIAGSVMGDGKGIAGAPVFLWPLADKARRSLRAWLQVLSDADGHYKFDGLPPGDYRLLSTFDISEVDQEVLDEAQAVTVKVEASQKSSVDLGVWVAP